MSSPPEYVPLLIATMYGADPTPIASSLPPVVYRRAYSVITQASRAFFGWVVTRLVSHVSALKISLFLHVSGACCLLAERGTLCYLLVIKRTRTCKVHCKGLPLSSYDVRYALKSAFSTIPTRCE